MKHIEICQLPIEIDYCFRDYDFIIKHFSRIPLENYNLVYTCDRCNSYSLDEAFEEFNVIRPCDYKARSLSVSDIVAIDGTKYFCDEFGWKEV